MRRLMGLMIAALAALLMTAGPGLAHSELESSSPENGAQLDAAPQSITLTFNEPVQGPTATVGVLVGDNDPVQVEAAVQGAVLTIDTASGPLADLLVGGADGAWAIGYQVVSADGHPIDGTLTFTVTAADAGAPGNAADDSAAAGSAADDRGEGSGSGRSAGDADDTAAASATEEDGGVTWWQLLLILAGSALVVFLVVKIDRARRKKRTRAEGDTYVL